MLRTVGYMDAGVNQILAAAKVPKGSFYHHFTTKDEFVLEVIDRYAAGEQQRWERLLYQPAGSPLKRLRAYFNDLIKTYGVRGGSIAGCLLGNMSLEVAGQNPEIRALLIRAFDAWQDAVARTVQEAVERHELPQTVMPEDIGALLVNGWEGAQVRAKALQSDAPLELFFRNAFDVLLKGPADPPRTKQRAPEDAKPLAASSTRRSAAAFQASSPSS
jgi:TetR/AcrR family transcriptional regulator, transcriptional repressor for nem operon